MFTLRPSGHHVHTLRSGGPRLKESGAYTYKFGKAVLKVWRRMEATRIDILEI